MSLHIAEMNSKNCMPIAFCQLQSMMTMSEFAMHFS